MRLIFCDTETTGLDVDIHEVWEVGIIIREYKLAGNGTFLMADPKEDEEKHWFLPLSNFSLADPFALDIGKFWDRYIWPDPRAWNEDAMSEWCRNFMHITKGAHIVGAVPNFDIERLDRLCRRYGYRLFNHYHLVDVEALVAGKYGIQPPWKSDDLFDRIGYKVNEEEKHTALGDARVCRDIYDLVMHNASQD